MIMIDDYFDIATEALQHIVPDYIDDRQTHNVWYRTVLMKYLRDKNFSTPSIGKKIHRNHATVLHSVKLYDDLMKYDKEFNHFVHLFKQYIAIIENRKLEETKVDSSIIKYLKNIDTETLQKEILRRQSL